MPAVPYKNPDNFQKIVGRLADEMDNTIWANQFDNPANQEAHLRTTGPEIWRDTDGKIDAFVSTAGTGGTIAGTSIFLKSKNRDVLTVLADPTGTATWNYVKHGEAKMVGRERTASAQAFLSPKGPPLPDVGPRPLNHVIGRIEFSRALFGNRAHAFGQSPRRQLVGVILADELAVGALDCGGR